jgi:phosphoribosylaminoimidazole-succinocarboxamide synthase
VNTLKSIHLIGFGKKYQGKVRDFYLVGDKRILITTDRISAFDRILGYIPCKGEILTGLSQFWFEQTSDIIENHLIAVADPNVMVVKNAVSVPIEMVVRGYISGVTGTSIWGSYEKGKRLIYGIKFPDGLKKNDKLPKPIITPTTKAEVGHDERLTRDEIIDKKIVSEKLYKQMEKAAIALFKRGQKISKKAGLILVDSKYEFGLLDGKLILIDEIHTPDSSRFWIADTYKSRVKKGLEPENFDKEFVRIWYKDTYGYMGDGEPPKMPKSFIDQVSKRYIDTYERLTGKKFQIHTEQSIKKRIKENMKKYYMIHANGVKDA